jgi:hypothetical protein
VDYEVMDYRIDLTDHVPGDVIPLPPGWTLAAVERVTGALACVLVREVVAAPPLGTT